MSRRSHYAFRWTGSRMGSLRPTGFGVSTASWPQRRTSLYVCGGKQMSLCPSRYQVHYRRRSIWVLLRNGNWIAMLRSTHSYFTLASHPSPHIVAGDANHATEPCQCPLCIQVKYHPRARPTTVASCWQREAKRGTQKTRLAVITLKTSQPADRTRHGCLLCSGGVGAMLYLKHKGTLK